MKYLKRCKSWSRKVVRYITADPLKSSICGTTLLAGLIVTLISGSGSAVPPGVGKRITVSGTTTTVEATPTYSQPINEVIVNPSGSETAGSSSTSTSETTEKSTSLSYTAAPTDALAMSPSAITVYKNTDNTQGLKAGVTTTAVQIKSGNGKTIGEPFVEGGSGISLTTTDSLTARSSWPLEASASSAALGSYALTIEAEGTDGVTYAGTLDVDVVSVPTFNLPTTSDVIAAVHSGSTSATFTGLEYSAGTSGGYAPAITATNLDGGNITCSSGLYYTDSEIICDDPNIAAHGSSGSVSMEFTFQNQFQEISIGGSIIFSN